MRTCPLCGVSWGINHTCTTTGVGPKQGTPHNHGEYIEGCFRCDLSRQESKGADA
jgi:hypothetical protein